MTRTVLFAIAGLILAGIIHIVAVLMVPTYAPADAWTRIAAITEPEKFIELSSDPREAAVVPMLDPLMRHIVCRYTLDGPPVRIRATLPGDFWSVALFNARGENVYSINNTAIGGDTLDMLILTANQLAQIRENPPEDLEGMLIIEQTDEDGFALIRAFVPDGSEAPEIQAGLAGARCEPQTSF